MMNVGSLDYCTQSHCSGWAASDGRPARVQVFINDRFVSHVQCGLDRPDLVAHGLPRLAGFSFAFPRPLRMADWVDVRFETGAGLAQSPSTQHRERLRPLLEGIDPAERGLELGPLNRPILGKAEYRVFYVDHASKAELLAKYAQAGTTDKNDFEGLEEVDYVWADRPLIAVAGGGFGYCLASHVIEHVADPIGWLGEIAAVLRPGGRINLAVPERTRTFDYRRTPSTAAAMVEAHRRGLRRPSFAQVFDHVAGVAPLGGPAPDERAAAVAAYRRAQEAEAAGEYVDVHCHVWDHDSFLACWRVIDALGLVPLRLAGSAPASGVWNEFTVAFERV